MTKIIDGIEYPDDYQTKTEPVKTETPKAETTPAVVENKPATVTKRSELKTWGQALQALPEKFSALQVESKRATIELGFAMQIIQGNSALQKCDPKTIYDAVIYSARIGITLNPAMRLCFLVPRGGKACLDISYMGMSATLKTYGAIKHIDGIVVYEDEAFDWSPATGELKHTIKFAKSEAEQKQRKLYAAYARAVLPDGLVVFEVIPAWELEKIKAVSASASKGFSPYTGWEGEMIRKAPIKRLAKKLHVLQTDERVAAMFEAEQQADSMNTPKPIHEDWTDAEDVTNETPETTDGK
jgi:phage RecT family recombinase